MFPTHGDGAVPLDGAGLRETARSPHARMNRAPPCNMAIPSHAASTTVESPAGMNVFADQAKPVAPSLGRASQPIRSPADSEPPAANSCSRMTSATAGRSGRSAIRGFPETRRPDSTIPIDVWGRDDHPRPEPVVMAAVQ